MRPTRHIWPISPISLISPISPISPIGLISLICLISSCSSEQPGPDVPEEKGTAIAFYASQEVETVTRAESTPLSDYQTSFKVWGYKNMTSETQTVMPGYTVHWKENSAATSTTNSDGWEYILTNYPDQTIKYWDFLAAAYRFFAVTNWGGDRPANTADYKANAAYGAPGTYEGGYQSYEVTMVVDATNISEAPYISRLWYSTGNITNYPTRQFGQPVTLEFLKIFSKVRFMFTYSYPDDPKLPTIERPNFYPISGNAIARKGTFTVCYPITGTATVESWTSDPDLINKALATLTIQYTDANKYWETVLPVRNQGAYILEVTINGEKKTCTVPAEYMSWLPGYQYTYIFKINEDNGVELESVQSGVTVWNEGSTGNHTIYNW